MNEGDEVIISVADRVSYPEMVAINRGTPVIAPTTIDKGFKLQPEDLGARSRRAPSGWY